MDSQIARLRVPVQRRVRGLASTRTHAPDRASQIAEADLSISVTDPDLKIRIWRLDITSVRDARVRVSATAQRPREPARLVPGTAPRLPGMGSG